MEVGREKEHLLALRGEHTLNSDTIETNLHIIQLMNNMSYGVRWLSEAWFQELDNSILTPAHPPLPGPWAFSSFSFLCSHVSRECQAETVESLNSRE